MKSASNTPHNALPEFPPNDLTAGVDWARDDHAVAIVDDRGREIHRCTRAPHQRGPARPGHSTAPPRGREVAIERPDGPVVETLLAAGLTVVVISPNQVKNLRGRYGSAGNKDDRFDAFVLADTLRTDRPRLRPLVPDSEATIALRRACRARKDLVKHRVAVANQLRAHLRNVFPGAVGLFAGLDSAISLAFLTRFDTQDRADWLTPKRLGDWLAKQGYSGGVDPAVLHQRLLDAPRGATGAARTTQAHITAATVALLRTLIEQIKALATQIGRQLDTAPRRPHLHQPAPLRARPRRPAAGRDRRLPRPVPHPRIADLPGRRSTLDPPVRQDCAPSGSAGPATNNSATPSATSPATPARPTPGPPTSTTAPAPAATTTPTPSASWPEPGSTSSGTAGKTTPPTTRPDTAPSNAPQPRSPSRGLTQGISLLLSTAGARFPTLAAAFRQHERAVSQSGWGSWLEPSPLM